MSWLWLLLLLALSPAAGAADSPVARLGLVVPLAADAGSVAQGMRHGADLAIATWRPKLNRQIELRVKEDVFDPKQAVAAAEQLVQEGVWGVVGHFYSSSSVAASSIYHEAGIPQVTATSTHPRLTTQGFDSVFRVCGRDEQQALVTAEFVVTRMAARRIGVVHDRTEYGRGLVETFRREVERRTAGRIVVGQALAQGDRDFRAQVTRLQEARLDAIYFGGVFREAGQLLRQLRQAGVGAAFLGGDAVLDPAFVELAGEQAALGAYLTFAPDPRHLESARPLIRQYESRYGRLGPHVVSTYDAVGVLLSGIEAGKPADPTKEELQKVVRAIRGRPYQGALGTLRWDKNGDLTPAPYVLYVTKRGGSVQSWFEPVSPTVPSGTAGKG